MKRRDCVEEFASAMERKLQKHDEERGEDGWLVEHAVWLEERLGEEVKEMGEHLLYYYQITEGDRLGAQSADGRRLKAMGECVDVANFAMMIWDKLRRE